MFSLLWLNDYLLMTQVEKILQQCDNNSTTNLYLTIILCRHAPVKFPKQADNIKMICMQLGRLDFAMCTYFFSSYCIQNASVKMPVFSGISHMAYPLWIRLRIIVCLIRPYVEAHMYVEGHVEDHGCWGHMTIGEAWVSILTSWVIVWHLPIWNHEEISDLLL